MDIRNRLIKRETDTAPNRYVAQAMGYMGFMMIVTEVMNELEFFHVPRGAMRWMTFFAVLCSGLAEYLGREPRHAENSATKYIIMSCVLAAVAAAMLAFEQWASLALFLPLLLAAQYGNRTLSWVACTGTCAISILSAPISCALGLWQADYLQFLTAAAGYETSLVPAESYNLLQALFEVTIYTGLPRLMICIVYSAIIFSMTGRTMKNLSARADQTDLSHIDTLTQMYSRLSYEEQVDIYRSKPPRSLLCIYADVNGLHETNNTEGHDVGDILLRNCAAALYNTFGPCVYRIGGDEFVVLSEENCNLLMRVKQVEDILAEYDCSMAIGSARMQEGEDVSTLVRRCEQLMYTSKKMHYNKLGRGR